MSDNVILPGTGESVATDDIGGVQYQRIKLVDSTENSTTPIGTASNPLPVKDEDNIFLMNRVLGSLESPRGYDKSLQRQRGTVVVESGTVTTVTTVTTVSTVSNIATIDGLQPRIQIYGANLSAWRDCVRSCIS
jgi:hypothetical protein